HEDAINGGADSARGHPGLTTMLAVVRRSGNARGPMAGGEVQVALVVGGGEGIGRAVALALAARGASVILLGADERRVAEVVGEIAHGGGRARHVVGDADAAA